MTEPAKKENKIGSKIGIREKQRIDRAHRRLILAKMFALRGDLKQKKECKILTLD